MHKIRLFNANTLAKWLAGWLTHKPTHTHTHSSVVLTHCANSLLTRPPIARLTQIWVPPIGFAATLRASHCERQRECQRRRSLISDSIEAQVSKHKAEHNRTGQTNRGNGNPLIGFCGRRRIRESRAPNEQRQRVRALLELACEPRLLGILEKAPTLAGGQIWKPKARRAKGKCLRSFAIVCTRPLGNFWFVYVWRQLDVANSKRNCKHKPASQSNEPAIRAKPARYSSQQDEASWRLLNNDNNINLCVCVCVSVSVYLCLVSTFCTHLAAADDSDGEPDIISANNSQSSRENN